MRLIELAAFVALGAIWGCAFLFIKYAAEVFPPFTLVALRTLSAAVIMIIGNVIYMFVHPPHREILRRHLKERKHFYLQVTIMGIINNMIPFVLVAWAESKPTVNVGVASVLDSAIPLFAQLFGHFMLKHEEKMTKQRVIGMVVGFGGVFVVCAEKMFDVGGDAKDSDCKACTIGYYIMIIVACASYGLASVYGKKYLSDCCSIVLASGQIISGSIVTSIIAVAWEFNYPVDSFKGQTHFSFMSEASARAWISIAYLGAVSTCIAYLLYFYLLATIGSVKQTMVGFLLPVFGIFVGVLFEDDWAGVSWVYKFLEILGAVLICGGIYFVNFGVATKHDPDPLNCEGPTEEKEALLGGSSSNLGRSDSIDSGIADYGTV